MLFYNMTEAAFKGGLLWLALLLGVIGIPERAGDSLRTLPLSTTCARQGDCAEPRWKRQARGGNRARSVARVTSDR